MTVLMDIDLESSPKFITLVVFLHLLPLKKLPIADFFSLSLNIRSMIFMEVFAQFQVRHAQLLENEGVKTSLLAKHQGGAHKLAIEPGSPHVFYSCGEDGLVQHVSYLFLFWTFGCMLSFTGKLFLRQDRLSL